MSFVLEWGKALGGPGAFFFCRGVDAGVGLVGSFGASFCEICR
ncbi:hypothetical protein ACT7DO_22995 [Bacillus pacificus]